MRGVEGALVALKMKMSTMSCEELGGGSGCMGMSP